MSWSSKFGQWSGRFSPFGRGDSSTAPVSDADFSYITSEDLARSQKNLAGDNNTDVLVLKHKRVSYPVHFPGGAIDTGNLTIRDVRAAAARKMDVDDPRRIKLFFKGRQLKDEQAARAVGLRSDTESEILCVVGEGAPFGSSMGTAGQRDETAENDDDDDGSESDDNDNDDRGAASGSGGRKKKRNRRGGKKSRKGRSSATPTPDGGANSSTYVGGGAGAEFLGMPASAIPPRPSSSQSHSKPAPANTAAAGGPQTAMQKLEELSSKFHTTLVPLCVQFMAHPPADAGKRDFEHKKLTETVLAQVLLKLDAVDTSGDERARARRKELVKECNGMLGRLDEVVRK